MSTTTRRVSVRTLLGDPAPVLEVLLEGLLPAVGPGHPGRRVDRARVDAAAEPVVPRPHRRAELRGEHPRRRRRPAGRRCRCRARRASSRSCGRSPTARRSAGRPSPRTSSSRGQLPDARAACRSRSRSWPAACCRRCPTEQCRPVAASTAARMCSANSRGSPRLAVALPRPRGTPRPSRAPRPRTGTPPHSSDRSVAITSADAASYAGCVDRQEHRVGALAGRDPQRHAGADAELAGLVRRRRHHAALGRVAATADDDRQPRQLGAAQHLDRRDELVEVDVQHPRLRGAAGRPSGRSRVLIAAAAAARRWTRAGRAR